MKENTRNMAVGITVLVALGLLAGMVLLFTGVPWFLQGGYVVMIASDKTHDIHPGDAIHLAGMKIGKVTDIAFTDPDRPHMGITITARIDSETRLPGNARAEFYTKGLSGSAYIELKPFGPDKLNQTTGEPMQFFPTDGSAVMDSKHFGESLVPEEMLEAMRGLTDLARKIDRLMGAEPALSEAQPAGTVPASSAATVGGLQSTVAKLNLALDAIVTVVGDAENQANLKSSLANVAQATEAATDAASELKKFASQAGATARDYSDLAGKVTTSAEQVSQLMATINRLATKVEEGEGTAGRLLSDPQLYDNLLEATSQMGKMLEEFRQLIELWKEHGVEIKVK